MELSHHTHREPEKQPPPLSHTHLYLFVHPPHCTLLCYVTVYGLGSRSQSAFSSPFRHSLYVYLCLSLSISLSISLFPPLSHSPPLPILFVYPFLLCFITGASSFFTVFSFSLSLSLQSSFPQHLSHSSSSCSPALLHFPPSDHPLCLPFLSLSCSSLHAFVRFFCCCILPHCFTEKVL